MLDIKDKHGNGIEIHSKVKVLITTGLDFGSSFDNRLEVFASVIAILSEDSVQCMPIGEGIPFKTAPTNLEVVSTVVSDILEASQDKDFQEIMRDAETRLENYTTAKQKRRGSGKGSRGKKDTPPNLAAKINMDKLL